MEIIETVATSYGLSNKSWTKFAQTQLFNSSIIHLIQGR